VSQTSKSSRGAELAPHRRGRCAVERADDREPLARQRAALMGHPLSPLRRWRTDRSAAPPPSLELTDALRRRHRHEEAGTRARMRFLAASRPARLALRSAQVEPR